MNPQEFAQKIRAKYPGAYDSISDDELTQKVIAKYPVYASQVKTQPQSLSERGLQSTMPSTVSSGQETMGDIKQVGSDIKQSFNKRIIGNFGEIRTALKSGEQGNLRSILQGAGQVAGFLGDTITAGAKGLVKGALSQGGEDKLKNALSTIAKPIVESQPVKDVVSRYEEIKKTDPAKARDIDAALGFTDFISNFVGLGGGKVAAETGAKVGAQAVKTGTELATKATTKVAENIAPKLLSYTSEIPEQAFKTLAERNVNVKKLVKTGLTPERTLEKTQGAVRTFRKTLSQEWDDGVKGIIAENTGVRFGLSDSFAKKVLTVADEFGVDLPQNLKDISALESINLLKKINELPKTMLTFSPKGAIVRDVKDGLRELSVKAFGGKEGKFSQLYKNYSTKKTVLDAANDIVNAYSNGKPIKMATAQARLEKIFDENKSAYLDAIMDLEKATGQDLLSDIAAGKFTKILPRTPSIKGGVAEKAFKLLILPLTSPRATAWIQTNLKKVAPAIERFTNNPKVGLSVAKTTNDFSNFHPEDQKFLRDFAQSVQDKSPIPESLLNRAKETWESYGYSAPTAKTKLADLIKTADESSAQKQFDIGASKGVKKMTTEDTKYLNDAFKKPTTPTFKQNPVTGKLEGSVKADPLLQEAKKYKSAEEFVKAQTNLNHASAGEIKEFVSNFPNQKPVFLTKDGNYYKEHIGADAKNTPVKVEMGKTITLDNKTLKEILDTGDDLRAEQFNLAHTKERNLVFDWLKANGYDSATVPRDWHRGNEFRESIVVFNPSAQIKTKSQLTDIWEKAHSIIKKK